MMQLFNDTLWFAPKRFGFGSGFPITWQGWLVTIALIGSLIVSVKLLDGLIRFVVVVAAIVAYLVICYWKTRGGWRWRWGSRS